VTKLKIVTKLLQQENSVLSDPFDAFVHVTLSQFNVKNLLAHVNGRLSITLSFNY